MKKSTPRTILFITGAFVSSACWEDWITFFNHKGYHAIAPPWPNKLESAETLREEHPQSAIAEMRLADLIHYFETIVKDLPEKPIVIGHSMGGLITQILIQKELVHAGVAIHSLQPQGVFTFRFSFYKAGWGALGFFTSVKKAYLMSFREWQYAFTNGMCYEEQKEAYYKLLTPESKLLVRDGITAVARVDFKRPHVPLLFVAGKMDHFIPASLNYTNYKKYSDRFSKTDYKVFDDRNHFVLGQEGWEKSAQYIMDWIEEAAGE